jgi:hypothetical protein
VAELDEDQQAEVALTNLPSFENNRFEIQTELAFHEIAIFRVVMRYLSKVRFEDPDYRANDLLWNSYLLNSVIEEAGVLSRGVTFGSITCFTRFVQSSANFITLAEVRHLQDLQIEAATLLPTLTDEALHSTYRKFSAYLGPSRAAILKRLWDRLEAPRTVNFRRATSPEYKPYVSRYLQETVEDACAVIRKHQQSNIDGVKCLVDAQVSNMFQERIFGVQSEVQNASRGGMNRTRGLAVCHINGTFATDYQRKKRTVSALLKVPPVTPPPPPHPLPTSPLPAPN